MRKDKEKSSPLFSILIPTYNRLNLLKETLDSVFNQTFTGPFEVIVVDDGSQDGTWEYLQELTKTKGNLKIFRHHENKGVAEARNSALDLAKGEYVLFLDSDDLLLSDTLEKVSQWTCRDPWRSFLLSVYLLRDSKKKVKIYPDFSTKSAERLKAFIDGKYSDALYVFKREELAEYKFDSRLKTREDWVLKAITITQNPPIIIKEPLGIIREHPARLRKEPHHYEESVLKSVEILFEKLPSELLHLKSYALAKGLIEIGNKFSLVKNYQQALVYYKKALAIYPAFNRSFRFLKKYTKTLVYSKLRPTTKYL